jgi:hypothetical protein
MARLNITWRSANDIAPKAAATGDAEAKETGRTLVRADRPMLVYVASDDETSSAVRKLEDVVFKSENVAVGAKLFDTVRVTAGDALQDRVLKEAGRETPRLVFLARDFTVDTVLEGKEASSGKVLKAMKRLAGREYKNNFDAIVRDYVKLLNDLDRLEGKKQVIAESRERLQAKPDKAKAKKLEREEKEYQQEAEAWDKAEKALLDLKPKTDEPAAEA